jgi:hypothetical protein
MGEAFLAAVGLAAGFIFLQLLHFTRYRTTRAEGQRLMLSCAVAAIALIVAARLVLISLEWMAPAYFATARAFWLVVFPAPNPWLGTCVWALVIAVVLARAINRFYSAGKASKRAIFRYGKELEKLFYGAMRQDRPVSLTLKNRKVYIGRIIRLPPILEGDATHIRLLPIMSGYRDEKTVVWTPTTSYTDAYLEILKGQIPGLHSEDFEIVIPVSEIITANLFSFDIDQKTFTLPPVPGLAAGGRPAQNAAPPE